MEAETRKPFVPITIILDTQDKVDQLYAVFNSGPISAAMWRWNEHWAHIWELLDKHVDKTSRNYTDELDYFVNKIFHRERFSTQLIKKGETDGSKG